MTGPSDQVANEKRLTTLLQEYQTLSAEFRTLITLGFVVVTMTSAAVVAALTVAFRLERQEILLVFPAIAIGIGIALTEFHMYYLSLGAYLANVEERINAILEHPPVLGWHSRAMRTVWPSSPIAGALQHDLGVGLASTALFLLMLALGARYIADLDQATWKSALYVSVYSFFYIVLWTQVLYRFIFLNPRRRRDLEERLSPSPSQPSLPHEPLD